MAQDKPIKRDAKARRELHQRFETRERRVPSFNPRWALNEFNQPLLGKMARLADSQLRRGEGILILEGEAGTGKNVLWDIFCHYTNREMLTFSCNDQSEKEDFTYRFGMTRFAGLFAKTPIWCGH